MTPKTDTNNPDYWGLTLNEFLDRTNPETISWARMQPPPQPPAPRRRLQDVYNLENSGLQLCFVAFIYFVVFLATFLCLMMPARAQNCDSMIAKYKPDTLTLLQFSSNFSTYDTGFSFSYSYRYVDSLDHWRGLLYEVNKEVDYWYKNLQRSKDVFFTIKARAKYEYYSGMRDVLEDIIYNEHNIYNFKYKSRKHKWDTPL